MSFHPKKASLSKLYKKHLEKQRIEFARERETPPPISLQSIRECSKEDCSFCKKTKRRTIFPNLQALEWNRVCVHRKHSTCIGSIRLVLFLQYCYSYMVVVVLVSYSNRQCMLPIVVFLPIQGLV